MFKKLNKLYEAVFGEDNNNCGIPCGDNESTLPLVREVRNLKYKVKRQGQIIDALLRELGYETDYDYSSLSGDETMIINKKSKK